MIEKWGHDWTAMKKHDPEVSEFVSRMEIVERLNPLDSFFGGRTNATQLYYKCKNGERIEYNDFTSLYPSVNKQCVYPVGAPTILTQAQLGSNTDITLYFGLIMCRVLPRCPLVVCIIPFFHTGRMASSGSLYVESVQTVLRWTRR